MAPFLADLQDRGERIRIAEVTRFRGSLASLDPQTRELVEELTRRIVDRLLHQATRKVMGAMGTVRGDLYADALVALFGLTPSEERQG